MTTLHSITRAIAVATLAVAALALPATAKNTADDWKWVNTHYADHGQWTTACEDRADDASVKRCYLRYVDVYARDPFGAVFVFGTLESGAPSYTFEFENGTSFDAPWTVSVDGATAWEFSPGPCRFIGECTVDGARGAALTDALRAGGTLAMAFTDGAGREVDLAWDGAPFAAAHEELVREVAARGL